MRGVNLRIDTSFGIPELDYKNSSIHQIKTHNKLLENLDIWIKKRYIQKIQEARWSSHDIHKFGFQDDLALTDNLLSHSHMYLTDEYGPDQSYLGGKRGENNSIEIYLNILRTMWKDYTPPQNIVNRRKIKKGINKTKNILIKMAFHRLKKNYKIRIGPLTPIGIKGLKVFISSITN
jgi:hypothetical protein